MKTFFELDIKQEIKDALADMGFENPTPVQSETIPYILEGRDCLAQAPTGTGKTCAFGIPAVNAADPTKAEVQTVILCPTRELALQTEKELKKLAAKLSGVRILAIYGGQNIERQLAGLRKKPQIIVGTPGRVIDHLRRRTLKLKGAAMLVLDEADEMLDMGFKEDIDAIKGEMPAQNMQVLLFSATIPKEIQEISAQYQKDPVSVKTTIDGEDLPRIAQYYVKLKETSKYDAFKRILREQDFKFVLVFVNTKRKADELNTMLDADGYLTAALHGDLRQRVRDSVMKSYRGKTLNILVATDVAARGIDVDNIEAIFNYDVPLDEEFYIHRIGRTARANRSGCAFSFVTQKDIYRLNLYEKLTGEPIEELKLDGLSDDKIGRNKKVPVGKKFFMNVGEKDGLTEKILKQFVTSKSAVKFENIEAVKILDIYSFVTVSGENPDETLTLNGEKFLNRRLAVEAAEEAMGGRRKNKEADGAKKPYAERGGREGAKKPYGERGGRDGAKKPYPRKNENKSSEQKSGSYKPREKFAKEYEAKPRPKKQFEKPVDAENAPVWDKNAIEETYADSLPKRNEFGTAVSYGNSRGEKRYGNEKRSSDKKPYSGRKSNYDKKNYADERNQSRDKTFSSEKPHTERKSYADKKSGDTKKPYVKKASGGGQDYRKFRNASSKKKDVPVTFGESKPKAKKIMK